MGDAAVAAELAGFNDRVMGDNFGLHQFTYNNSKLLELMFNNLHSLQFRGIVVRQSRVSSVNFCLGGRLHYACSSCYYYLRVQDYYSCVFCILVN